MPPRRDRLAEDLVATATELQRRRLWLEVAGDALFLVRVPTEEEPLVANVLGQAGEEYGLLLARGEEAFLRLASLALDLPGGRAFREDGEFLSVSFEPWGELPDEMRRLAAAAGIRPRRERVVPMALARDPTGELRPATRSELRTLLWAVRGVLVAHDAGELEPSPLDPGEQHVLELEVTGETRRPDVTARRVPWPQDPTAFDVPPLAGLPEDMAELPRRGERWLFTRVELGEGFAVLFVADETDGVVLADEVYGGHDLDIPADVLVTAFAGEGRSARPGLPCAVVFDDPRLRASFAPALSALDVAAELEPDNTALRELHDEFGAALDASRGSAASGEPSTLRDWKDADWEVSDGLIEAALGPDLPPDEPLVRYFGSARAAERLRRDGQVALAFAEWLAADDRPREGSPTLLDEVLSRDGLAAHERALLDARRNAHLSVFRVVATDPGATLEVEDVLSGERHTIHDRAFSGTALEGDFLPLRVYRAADWSFATLAGPPLAGPLAIAALDELERLGAPLAPSGLRPHAHLVGRLWSWHAEHEAPDVELGSPGFLSAPSRPATPEDPEALQDFVREPWRRWLDEAVPLLGHRTPRQACATEEGRQRVARLVRAMPPIQTPHGPVDLPREELLRELGLGVTAAPRRRRL